MAQDMRPALEAFNRLREKRKAAIAADTRKTICNANCDALGGEFRIKRLQPEQLVTMRTWLAKCNYAGKVTPETREAVAKIVMRASIQVDSSSLLFPGNLGDAMFLGLSDADLDRLHVQVFEFNGLAAPSAESQEDEANRKADETKAAAEAAKKKKDTL